MSSRAAAIDALEARLGYAFKDRGFLEQALTHASKQSQGRSGIRHNERMEFLGDRVLGLAIASALYARFPDDDPDELTNKNHHLVSRQSCAEIARLIGVPEAMDVQKDGGLRKNQTALADTCEAIIAAVFLDAGFEQAGNMVVRLWADLLDKPIDVMASNPKLALQMWAQRGGRPLPTYTITERTGPPHAPTITVELRVEGVASVTTQGRSRQEAEKLAAVAMLKREGAA